ncbi:MAG: carboxypeptidase regulatory-like domain-containing protein [Bryobacterales bacterium]
MPIRLLALALIFLFARAAPLPAYIQNRRLSGAPMSQADFTAIPYSVDSRTAAGMRNSLGQFTITAGSDPLLAVQDALDSWTNISSSAVRFAPFQTSTGIEPRNDGVNLITFADTPSTRSLVGDAVAVTFLFSRLNGALTDTDIVFNPRLRFSTEPDPTTFDIQGTLAHELGHAIGLYHTAVVGATMYASTTRGTSRIARLTSDDIAFARDIYPATQEPASGGQIEGRVSYSFGVGVEGAHVVAVDPAQNILVAAISRSDGSYRIGGVPPGRYWLYCEPLDGPADEAQLGSMPLNLDIFPTNFHGGLGAPLQLEVTPGAALAADLVVANASPTLNLEGSAAAPAGVSNPDGLLAEMQPGGLFDVEVYGAGLDSAEIHESSISFLGAGINLVEGSLKRGTARFTDGSSFPLLSFRVEVPSDTPAGLVTVLIATSSEVAALTGGIAIVDPLPAPLFSSNSVTNAASFLPGPVTPGGIVSIFGLNLGPEQGVSGGLDEFGRVVTMLGDVTVTFNGLPAPLFFVGSGQINVQVPVELAGAVNALVLVLVQRGQSASVPISVAAAAAGPGLFTLGAGPALVALNQDGTVNGVSNGAARGSIITLFGTGQGLASPPLATGQPAGAQPLSEVVAPVTVMIGGQIAEVKFAGMAPGFAGLLQINAVIPAGASGGQNTPVEVIIGGVATGQNGTIAVQ